MEWIRFHDVEAFVAIDLDGCPVNAGGTRLAPDVTEEEVALLARAMTYKFAALSVRTGGAKGGVRGTADRREELLARYCEAIRPLVESARFLTGPDLGTYDADFAPLRREGAEPGVMATPMDGLAFEDVLTGYGVVAAAEAALGSLEGCTFAIEGFGKVGGGVAREAVRRGARVVAVSTIRGAVFDEAGLGVDALWRARARRGDALVEDLGLEVLAPAALFEVEADVVVPGARTGVIDEARARRLRARAVAPAANVPYARGAPAILHERGVLALADFVCNAGAVLGYLSPRGSTHPEVLATVEERLTARTKTSLEHPDGPFAGACRIAEDFLRGWRGAGGLPPAPPLA